MHMQFKLATRKSKKDMDFSASLRFRKIRGKELEHLIHS